MGRKARGSKAQKRTQLYAAPGKANREAQRKQRRETIMADIDKEIEAERKRRDAERVEETAPAAWAGFAIGALAGAYKNPAKAADDMLAQWKSRFGATDN